jgi:hypothetical protein
VATVLTKVHGDLLGATHDRVLGGSDDIGVRRVAQTAKGGDVVDVDAKAAGMGRGHRGDIAQDQVDFTRRDL